MIKNSLLNSRKNLITIFCFSILFISTKLFAQPFPIVFVTQIPKPSDFTTIGAVFGNHKASMKKVGRGGDLWIKYPDGTFKNLTASAGYGNEGQQGSNSIAVRDPSVHWSGNKVIFSMVVGAPTKRYEVNTFYWQLYEITGLGQNETPVITKVPNQPLNYNNISPIYGTDDRIIFTTDRPRDGLSHLYPQLDEYEMEPTNTGLWSLDPATGNLKLLNHAPSGDFTPLIDSFGRVIFTQWDHLQQDQMADADRRRIASNRPLQYGTFNYSSEDFSSVPLFYDRTEVFPEPRDTSITLAAAGANLEGHRFNHFFPWMINEDGTELETLNHIGRHELSDYLARTFNDDSNIREYYGQIPRINDKPINNMLQITEHPHVPGRFIGIDAPEFRSHSAGQIISLDAPPSMNPDQIKVTWMTHRDTSGITSTPSANHSGLYRDPLVLADGSVIAAHTFETREDRNIGSRANPRSMYDFRLKQIVVGSNGYFVSGTNLTNGISKTISYWDPDQLVTYSGPLWEWQPVELRPQTRPAKRVPVIESPEQQIFTQANVNINELKAYLKKKKLGLIISRDVTSRDDQDQQQPFNLRVAGTNKQTTGASGKIYDVANFQIFQADQLRGMRRSDGEVIKGRRVLGQPMHDEMAVNMNPDSTGLPTGSVNIAEDGSVAAFVPAERAISWQTVDPASTPVVRERNWLTIQPGEIRMCPACHGVNDKSQSGATSPVNPPQALLKLLNHWKATLSVRNDFDDNNTSDILWKNSSDGLLWMFKLNKGRVKESVPVARVSDLNWQIAGIGDFNKDGNADLLWRHRTSGLNWIYMMEGSLVLQSLALNTVSDLAWKVEAVDDFNNDGKSDILWRNQNTGDNRLYLMNGNIITEDVLINKVTDPDWKIAGTGDLNNDGYADIVWRHATNGANWVFLMQGKTILSSLAINTIPDSSWIIAGLADFNADGKTDILWKNNNTGLTWIYLMDGNIITANAGVGQVSDLNWEIASVRDFNGDQKADILWRHKITGNNYLYIMNGTQLSSHYLLNNIPDPQWKIIDP